MTRGPAGAGHEGHDEPNGQVAPEPVLHRDGTAEPLPRKAFDATGLGAVFEWARAAGVDCRRK